LSIGRSHAENGEEGKPADENLRMLRAGIHVAAQVGRKLGGR
jgi:hypothetical protein